MDPATTRMAMEAMGKMSPQQMQQMMANMPKNMSPDMMSNAMAQMQNMQPSDWDAAKKQIENMSPDDISRQAAASSNQASAQQQYTMTASTQLKAQGNQMHSAGKFSEAVEKYERAKGNVASFVTAPAVELRKACTLNLSSCYLNLKQYGNCVVQCGEVLADDPNNVKALYRRGQALTGLNDWEAAVVDLTAAFRGTAGDLAQQTPIKEKLQEAKDQLSRARQNGTLLTKSVIPTPSVTAAPAASHPGMGGMGGMTPEMMQQASQMMRDNPAMAEQAQQMMANMDPELLRSMGAQFGGGGGSGGGGFGAGMDPALMSRMAAMQATALADGLSPTTITDVTDDPPTSSSSSSYGTAHNTTSNSSSSSTYKPVPCPPMMNGGMSGIDPRMAAEMLSNMDPAQLEAMTAAMPGGGPMGMKMTPELAKMAAQMMKNMSPEEMANMTQMANNMRNGAGASAPTPTSTSSPTASPWAAAASLGGETSSTASVQQPAGGSGGGSSSSSTAAAGAAVPGSMGLAGPGGVMTAEKAQMASQMMGNMTAEDLSRMSEMAASMGMGGGVGMPTMTPEMAKMASNMMANMKPEDMASMASMAASFGGAGGMGAAGGRSQADMMSMMNSNPKMMESALSMMNGMDADSLSAMLLSTGMVTDPEKAKVMATSMKSLKPGTVSALIKVTSFLSQAAQKAMAAKAWAEKNLALVMGVLVLLVALLLRWRGYL